MFAGEHAADRRRHQADQRRHESDGGDGVAAEAAEPEHVNDALGGDRELLGDDRDREERQRSPQPPVGYFLGRDLEHSWVCSTLLGG
ncbi:hypothetical protein ACFQFH_12730 [Halobaculum halobium]|uniref:hypothetical protein n=1 Tax=Halobaculum halobium TaxID=3032281 RepID=UPI0036245F41